MQAQEVRTTAVSSLQACISTAVQAGNTSTAVAAAELVAACLGKSDAQAAAEAILIAQSAAAAGDLEALYRDAAGPQVGHRLVMSAMQRVHVHSMQGFDLQRVIQSMYAKRSFESCPMIF